MSLFITEFDFCNLGSIKRFLTTQGIESIPLTKNCALGHKDILIIPGVGTFKSGMDYIITNQLEKVIKEACYRKTLIIGICLGMQLLLCTSEESPGVKGLCLIDGVVKKIPRASAPYIPIVGWNSLQYNENHCDSILSNQSFVDLTVNKDFYFVHGYSCHPSNNNMIASMVKSPFTDKYPIVSAIANDRVVGFQFHPEKSGFTGYSLLSSIIKTI